MYCFYRLRVWYYRRQVKLHYTAIAMAPIGTSKSALWLRTAKRKYNRAATALNKLDASAKHMPIAQL